MAFSFGLLSEENTVSVGAGAEEFRPLFPESPAEEAADVPSPDPAPVDDGVAAAEVEKLVEEAYDNGFAAGRSEAEESFAAVCRALSATIVEVGGVRERIIRESEESLLRLAVMVAKQVVQQELSMDRKILAQFVAEAVRAVADQDEIVIGLNPEDCRLVSANRHLYLGSVADKRQLSIKPDDTVPVGGCIVETPTGLIDARVEAQLAEIFKRLMQERGHHAAPPAAMVTEAESFVAEQYGADKYGYHQH